MAVHPEDDAFHEIQLNAKQLAALFMAATVVSVVIFLCGVLVGRGVRAERATAEAAGLAVASPPEVRPSPPPSASSAPASDPTTAAPPPAVDDLSYAKRLGQNREPVETLTPAARREEASPPAPVPEAPAKSAPKAAEKPADKPANRAADKPAEKTPAQAPERARTDPDVPAPVEESAAVPQESASSSKPAGKGYVVQVAALNDRSEADAIAKKFESKGYAAFVLPPVAGAPTIYRVRVGTYKTKREAESIAAKLRREERVKPWVTR